MTLDQILALLDMMRHATYDHGLYGTDLPGDPSSWDPESCAELAALLAIANLPIEILN